MDDKEYDWGCDYCRNDGKLFEGVCPECDAEYPDVHDDPVTPATSHPES